MTPIVLSPKTYSEIIDHVRATTAGSGAEGGRGPGGRKLAVALVTDGESDPALSTLTYRHASGTWETFATNCQTIPMRAGLLQTGSRYFGYIGGEDSDGRPILVVDPDPAVKCHLDLTDDGELKVTPGTLAGFGLTEGEEGEDGCTKLDIDLSDIAGCHTEWDDDEKKLNVTADTLAGGETKGIVTEEGEGGCDVLKVAVCDCNVELTSCGVRVKASGLVAEGGGLTITDDECPKIKLEEPGCHLYLDENGAIAVDVDSLAGGETKGIIAVEGEGIGDCSKLEVAVCPCNMELTSCGIRAKASGLIEEGSGLTLTDDECPKIKLKLDCHLTVEDAEFGSGLSVDVGSLIDGSMGLEVKEGEGEGEEATCPTLEAKVDPCNMELSSEGIRAKVSNMVEEDGGLKVEDEGGCGKISVDYDTVADKLVEDSCGLIAAAGVISVDNTQLFGEGLKAGADCTLDVDTGCGVKIEGGKVAFDAEAAAGGGLEADGCKLKVKTSCGLEEGSGGGLAVKAGDIAGTYLEPEEGCKIRLKGTIRMTKKIKTITIDTVIDMSGVTFDCETGFSGSPTATNTVTIEEEDDIPVYSPYADDDGDTPPDSWWCVGSPETVPSCMSGSEDDASAAAAAIDPVTGTYSGPYSTEAECNEGCI